VREGGEVIRTKGTGDGRWRRMGVAKKQDSAGRQTAVPQRIQRGRLRRSEKKTLSGGKEDI